MEPLQIIKDEDIFETSIIAPKFYTRRPTASGIIFDEDGQIGVIATSTHSLFPNEKVKKHESAEEAFIRVAKERCGCDIAVVSYIGHCEEYRALSAKKFEVYFFIAYIVGQKGAPLREKKDESIEWKSRDEVRNLFEDQLATLSPELYAPLFDTRTHYRAFEKFLEMQTDV